MQGTDTHSMTKKCKKWVLLSRERGAFTVKKH